jgi:hypothetical protein
MGYVICAADTERVASPDPVALPRPAGRGAYAIWRLAGFVRWDSIGGV